MAADVIVKFLTDTTQLQAGIREVEGTGAKLTSFAKGVVASIGGAALATGIYKSVKAASDLNETMAASEAVFGKSAKGIQSWASQASSDFGQSKQQALEAATGFGSMFDQMGMGVPQAAKMSKTMVELASDFASFKNVDISQVLEAQSSAFRGEYDAMQKFVPTLSAATIETKALAMTGKENASSLTAQEKAAATYAYMIEHAGKALGDYDRTADGAANKQKQLAAQMADLQATVGGALLPVFQKFLGVVSTIGDAFASLPGPVQSVVAVLGIAAAAMGLLWSAGVNVVNAVKAIAGAVGSVVKAVPGMIAALAEMTAAEAVATAGISLLVAGVALLAFHFLSQKSAADEAADAGTKWASKQVENARAAGDVGMALSQLLPTSRAVTAALKDATAERDRLTAAMQKEHDYSGQVTSKYVEMGQAAAELDIKIAGLQAKHETLAPAIEKLRREQELAAIAEAQRRIELDSLAAANLSVSQATDTQAKSVTQLTNAYLASQGGALAYEAAQLNVEQAQNRVNEVVAKFGPDSLEARQATNDLSQANLAATNAAYNLQASQGSLANLLKTQGVSGLQALRASLVETIAQHGDATGAVGRQIEKIDALIVKANTAGDIKKTAKIDADTADANRKLDETNNKADNATRPRSIKVQTEEIDKAYRSQFATGGIVPGPRNAPRLAIVHGGERIIPTSRAGGGAPTASGSSSGSSTFHITINVPASSNPAAIGAATVDAIRHYERVAGKAWRA